MDIQFLTNLDSSEAAYRDLLHSCRMDRIKKLALFYFSSLSLFVLSTLNAVRIMRSSPRLAPLVLAGNALLTSSLYRRIIYPMIPELRARSKEESRLKKILYSSDLSVKELDANSPLTPFCQKIFQQILYKVREKTLVLTNRMISQPDWPFFESTIQKYHLPALQFYALKAIENHKDRPRIKVDIEPFSKSSSAYPNIENLAWGNPLFVESKDVGECFPLLFGRLTNDYRKRSMQTVRVRMSLLDFISAQNYPEKIQEALAGFN